MWYLSNLLIWGFWEDKIIASSHHSVVLLDRYGTIIDSNFSQVPYNLRPKNLVFNGNNLVFSSIGSQDYWTDIRQANWRLLPIWENLDQPYFPPAVYNNKLVALGFSQIVFWNLSSMKRDATLYSKELTTANSVVAIHGGCITSTTTGYIQRWRFL